MSEQRFAAATFSQLKDGEMRETTLSGTNVLLARVGDRCFAVGANCTHYGAPLVDGFLNGNRIVCPWHHACFDIRNGACEEPPAIDALPNYKVTIEDDKVFVTIPTAVSDRRTPEMTKREAGDDRVFVIIGGGAAGYMAAQTLREDGFTGRVVMITQEQHFPYDRPNLSKDYLHGHAEPEWIPLRSEEFFSGADIEVLREKKVERVDPPSKTVTFEGGEVLTYDSLLIATGASPRKLPFQNPQQKNVFMLRSFDDADAIIAAAESGKRVVVIGASFIGMETAASLRQRGCEVTVVTPDEFPMMKVLGPEIGREFQAIHESNGVAFRLKDGVKAFVGGTDVEAVELRSGERVPADLVVVGIGVEPITGFLSGVTLHDDGGVMADAHMRIADGIYAAGDITHFPDPRTGELTRIEHWRTAMQQGRTAAHNMAGKRRAFDSVPFFWTTQFDVTLNYVGHVSQWDRILFDGKITERNFLAFYVKDFRVLAVAGVNRDKQMAYFEELIRLNRMPPLDKLEAELRNPSKKAAAVTGSYLTGNGL
jgi:NADPH-dependent 2,4-dienoyl-CoA reductase/sulfur reductase-like enzyme/nitrite reductase/ring-hydroxylating ferredoxin subunit